MEVYTREFYESQSNGSRRSAQQIIPLVLSLIEPKSVIDVGCGVGAWLSVFREFGIDNVLGIDGDWVKEEMLQIPPDHFRAFDLTQHLEIPRQFDLVVSVEVAEHLPPACAKTFVDSLAALGPAVMFSAAIPHQGGNHHVNEQWPEYWVKLFDDKDYQVIDCIRSKIWQNPEVDWTYAQNVLLFARRDYLQMNSRLKKELEHSRPAQISLVHPRKYLETIDWIERLHQAAYDVVGAIPPKNSFILIDDNQLGIVGTRAIPFLEKDGQFWGAPPDDATAIAELERMRQSGANFLVIAWPAFWWREYYSEFIAHVRSNYGRCFENERIVLFDLCRSSESVISNRDVKTSVIRENP